MSAPDEETTQAMLTDPELNRILGHIRPETPSRQLRARILALPEELSGPVPHRGWPFASLWHQVAVLACSLLLGVMVGSEWPQHQENRTPGWEETLLLLFGPTEENLP